MTDDAGPDLPAYPALPVIDNELQLDRLEPWMAQLCRGSAELDAAFVAVVRGEAPDDDMPAVACRMTEFHQRRREDLLWALGWLRGRYLVPLLHFDTAAIQGCTTDPVCIQGKVAGAQAAARRLRSLGLSVKVNVPT